MTNLTFSTTIRLTEEQKIFLDGKREKEKNWDFAVWVRKKLDEMMHKDSSFLKYKIETTKDEKIANSKKYDDEVKQLHKELEEAELKEKLRDERLKQHTSKPREYGSKVAKKGDGD